MQKKAKEPFMKRHGDKMNAISCGCLTFVILRVKHSEIGKQMRVSSGGYFYLKGALERSDEMPQICKEGDQKCLKGVAKYAASAKISRDAQAVFTSHKVLIDRTCVKAETDAAGRKAIKALCEPGDTALTQQFREKIDALNQSVHSEHPKDTANLGIGNFITFSEMNGYALDYASLKKHHDRVMGFDVAISLVAVLAFYASLKAWSAVERRVRSALERRRLVEGIAPRKRRHERQPKDRCESERSPRLVTSSCLARDGANGSLPKLKKRVRSREELAAQLDTKLETLFGLGGLVEGFGNCLDRNALERLLAEPRSIYFEVRDKRKMLSSRGFDPDKVMEALREKPDKPSDGNGGMAAACPSVRSEPDFESVMEGLVFTDESRAHLDGLRESERKAFLRTMWKYRNGLLPPKTYDRGGGPRSGLLGLNFGQEGRVLFTENKEEGRLNILFVGAVHGDYDKALDRLYRIWR